MDKKEILIKARAAKTRFENQYTKARKEGKEMPVSPHKGKKGWFNGKTHTEETKRLLREKALASPHRRLKKGTVLYNNILLDSSWELALAIRLDELNIPWIRPNPLQWIDKDGLSHNYFPDFYLPEYDLFLDPKNHYAIKVQKEKLDIILSQYNIMILDTIEQCKTFSRTDISNRFNKT